MRLIPEEARKGKGAGKEGGRGVVWGTQEGGSCLIQWTHNLPLCIFELR